MSTVDKIDQHREKEKTEYWRYEKYMHIQCLKSALPTPNLSTKKFGQFGEVFTWKLNSGISKLAMIPTSSMMSYTPLKMLVNCQVNHGCMDPTGIMVDCILFLQILIMVKISLTWPTSIRLIVS